MLTISLRTRTLLSCILSYVLLATLLAPFGTNVMASRVRTLASDTKQAAAPRRDSELLVRFAAGVTERSKDEIVSSKGALRKGKLRGESAVEKLELQSGQDLTAEAERLRRQPGVEFVEPNFLVKHDQMTPTDVRFSEQWALRNSGQNGGNPGSDVHAPAVWQETVGSYSTIIAVVDSGIDFTHPDLAASRWLNSGEVADNRQDDERDGYVDDVSGWDWVAKSGAVRDEQGHGTAVAGVIAAEGNNGRGVAGVMWRASLMSLRVLDSTGTGDVASAVEAIDYAVAHGASVINCSWGMDTDSQFLKEAIGRASRNGVVVVTSAGNSGRDIDARPYYPASYDLPNLIAVASSDNFDNLATFSNRGATRVAIAAPGTDILTTQMGGDYRLVSGTSASAPVVTGIAGLIKTLRPNAQAAAVRTAILAGARRVDALAGKVSSGGVADATGSLAALRGNPYAGNGNGRGNGNGGQYVPPALRRDNDHAKANGKDGEKATSPEPRTGAPLSGLPDLAESRKRRSSPPPSEPSAVIHSDLACADCNPSSGGVGNVFQNDPYVGTARTRPENEVGGRGDNIGSRNFNWSVPLVRLPGRAGLDLSLTLYYNSLVWTRQDTQSQAFIVYNADHGTPAPGFQLGMPRLQAQFLNSDTGAFAYIMITPSGGRVEMRQVTTGVYESADSTYTQLIFSNSTPVVRSTDGTQYIFGIQVGAEWRCTQIKDRNGNYISASYDTTNGHVLSVTDTLNRTVYFNYDSGTGLLASITQSWGNATHYFATFSYGDKQLALSFSGVSPQGAQNGSNQTVLNQVALGNGESYHFDYNGYGQVYQIKHSTPLGYEMERTRYDLTDAEISMHTPQLNDCPRFAERHDWARYWNGDTDGVYSTSEEALTSYSVTNVSNITHPVTGQPFSGTLTQVTTADGTLYKEYSKGTGWEKGLTQLSEEWPVEITQSGPQNVKRKWVGYVWTQDNTSLTFAKNARISQMNVYDGANERQTTYEYNSGYSLPTTVREWGKINGQMTLLRRMVTDYNLDSAYLNSRVIGLPWQKQVYDGAGGLVGKVQFYYDWDGGGDMFTDTPAAATHHDRTNYGPSFLTGRGNLSDVIRYDINDPNNQGGTAQETKYRVNTTGSVVMVRDAGWHANYIGYGDWFSDNNNSRNTFAYPTTLTDAEGYSSTTQYNYDFGAVTFTHTPSSGTGTSITYVDVARTYYADGRVQQISMTGGAYQRFVYDDNLLYVHSYETITGTTTSDEFHSFQALDGAGRVRASAADHPGSTGGFSGGYVVYDKLGRVIEYSNPTEIDEYWNPTGDDVLNTSQNTGGWRTTQQSYDWKGRPKVTINTDGTTRVLSYDGCGCAGGAVTTAQDEHGRQRRYTQDTIGRLATVEELNWNGSVYSTTQYAYNARDQITQINQQGQVRTFDYDGHGRLWHKTTPEQGQTTYTYYADDLINVVTDARGTTATYSYTSRHQVSGIDYNAPAGSGAAQTADVGNLYDAAGNRFWMTDGEGSTFRHYDSLGRLDWEDRNFTNIGTYRLAYDYNTAGELKKITYPWQFGNVEITYAYDKAGRLTSVGGSGYAGVTNYANSIAYRAFGVLKGMSYGDGSSLATSYDRRLRPTKWDVGGVLGYKYYYDDFNEHSGRVTFAQSIIPSTANLDRTQTSSIYDRSYEYDQVGRLAVSHAGAEARAHAWSGQWGTADGNYSQGYDYDAWGNITHRYGWGGEVQGGSPSSSTDLYYTYATDNNGVINNRRAGFTYDAAGNLTFDGGQHFTYDVQGNQVYVDWMHIDQGYDGDGLRVRRSADNTNPARYLRSTVLGGKVIAEIDYSGGSWVWWRGYVYSGAETLAVQQGGVYFVHEDPVTKSKRVTGTNGVLYGATELDPYGADAGGYNTAFQPRKFTSYERDPNGTDEAMFRRYNRWHARFDQPDPYNGSYDYTNPQSFNRYSYTENDPVNHVDPTGLLLDCITERELRSINPFYEPGFGPNFRICAEGGGGGGFREGGGRGGGGGGQGRRNPPAPKVDDKLLSAINTCLKQLDPNLYLISFSPSGPGVNGKLVVGMLPNDTRYTIQNFTNRDSAYLEGMRDADKGLAPGTSYARDKAAGNFLPGYTPRADRGNTQGDTYTASDRARGRAETPSLAQRYGGFIETQLHESAHGLGERLKSDGRAFDDKRTSSADAGKDFADCISREVSK